MHATSVSLLVTFLVGVRAPWPCVNNMCPGTNMICTPGQTCPNAPCNGNDNTPCAVVAGSTCMAGMCSDAPIPGGPCTMDTQCTPPMRCNTATMTCEAAAGGTRCTMDADCPTATPMRCNTATMMCEARTPAATACTMDTQCTPPMRCNTATMTCEAAANATTPCTMDAQCPTNMPRCNTVTMLCEQTVICQDASMCPPAAPFCVGMLCSAMQNPNMTMTNMTMTNMTVPGGTPGACMDKTVPGRLNDCPEHAALCNNPLYYDLMTEQCPATCGRCQQGGAGGGNATAGCEDLTQGGRASDCPQSAHLCNNAVYRPLMAVQCRRTCGLCGAGVQGANTNGTLPVATGSGCSDKALPGKASECPSVAHLCTDSRYVSVMRDQCAQTCGFCSGK